MEPTEDELKDLALLLRPIDPEQVRRAEQEIREGKWISLEDLRRQLEGRD